MKNKKPIIVHIITSLQIGGAEIFLADLIDHLTDYEHIVIFFLEGPVHALLKTMKINCIQIDSFGKHYNPLSFFKLFKIIRNIRPSCIKTDSWMTQIYGTYIAYILKIPCIAVLHSTKQYHGKWRILISRILPLRPQQYIAVSSTVYESFYDDYKKHPFIIINNGIDYKKVWERSNQLPTHLPPELKNICQENFIIGSVGRFIAEKNFELLINVIARMQQYEEHPPHLLIVGTGNNGSALKNFAHERSVAHMVHIITHQIAYPFYKFFHCFIQPSLTEGISIALLEALSLKIPSIVSGKHYSHPVINHQSNGLIIDIDQYNTIYDAILLYKNNQQLRNEMGEMGFETVKNHYSLQRSADQYHLILKHMIHKK